MIRVVWPVGALLECGMEIDQGPSFLQPGRLAGLSLRNRIIRAACYEGMSRQGRVTDALVEHHRRLAEGGVAMTTVAYGAISADGRTFEDELLLDQAAQPQLRKLSDAVHRAGAAVSLQLCHSGFFTSRAVIGEQPMGASPRWCLFTRSRCRQMTAGDIEDTVQAYVRAALLAREAGFDAVELHAGHGYLLSQFLSPWTNRRDDGYGGALENRLRFPVQVVRQLRSALGSAFPILVKMNLADGMAGGLQLDEAEAVARTFEREGASALVPSSGFTARVPFLMLRGRLPVAEMCANQDRWLNRAGLRWFGRLMVPEHPYRPLFHLEGARRIRRAVGIPVIYLGGVESREGLESVLSEGFEFVQVGRATIQDPDFVRRLATGEINRSACDHCNRCVAAMDGGGVYCVSNQLGFLNEGNTA